MSNFIIDYKVKTSLFLNVNFQIIIDSKIFISTATSREATLTYVIQNLVRFFLLSPSLH